MSRQSEPPRGRQVPSGSQGLSPSQYGQRGNRLAGVPQAPPRFEPRVTASYVERERAAIAAFMRASEGVRRSARISLRGDMTLYPEEAVSQWHQIVDELVARQRAELVREYTSPAPRAEERAFNSQQQIVRNLSPDWLDVAHDYSIEDRTMRIHVSLVIPDGVHDDLRRQMDRMRTQMSHTDFLAAILRLINGERVAETRTGRTYDAAIREYAVPRQRSLGDILHGVDHADEPASRPVPTPVAPTCQNPLSRRRSISLD